MKREKKGFTLIELLIVVAIIAILAAIAVPNFLEAQTRAKVSRAKADQRSVATAIEAYVVDYNVPPIGYEESATGATQNPAWNAGNWWGIVSTANPATFDQYVAVGNRVFGQMTTPVAFISAPPKDPFFKFNYGYTYGGRLKYFDYDRWGWINAPTNGYLAPSKNSFAQGQTWTLISYGPMQTWLAPFRKQGVVQGLKTYSGTTLVSDAGVGGLYDPTNGTMSYGWIIRTNKGIPSRIPTN